MHQSTVLVVEDDSTVAELIRRTLADGGFDVIQVADGAAALDVAWNHKPDVLVLDVGLPGIDGLEVCRRLRADRRTHRMPVLMLSARGDEADRIVGLELGADDYVIKPFSPREVLARVKTLIRRTTQQPSSGDVIRHRGMVIDAQRHEVSYDGQPVSLTATEFRVLQYLASAPGRVRSRDEIIAAACSEDSAVFDRTIDAHVKSIRRKLGAGGDEIETVRGFGYRLRDA
jgi:two-component system phosphate regulon response regulator PhoB